MPGENEETVRAAFEALEQRDEQALLDHVDPDVDWHPTAFLTGTSSYRGHDGVRKWIDDVSELEKGGSQRPRSTAS